MPRVVVVLTDGAPSLPLASKKESEALRANGTVIIGVGIGKNFRKKYLEDMTGDPKRVFTSAQTSDLVKVLAQVTKSACKGKRNGDGILKPVSSANIRTRKGSSTWALYSTISRSE